MVRPLAPATANKPKPAPVSAAVAAKPKPTANAKPTAAGDISDFGGRR